HLRLCSGPARTDAKRRCRDRHQVQGGNCQPCAAARDAARVADEISAERASKLSVRESRYAWLHRRRKPHSTTWATRARSRVTIRPGSRRPRLHTNAGTPCGTLRTTDDRRDPPGVEELASSVCTNRTYARRVESARGAGARLCDLSDSGRHCHSI